MINHSSEHITKTILEHLQLEPTHERFQEVLALVHRVREYGRQEAFGAIRAFCDEDDALPVSTRNIPAIVKTRLRALLETE